MFIASASTTVKFHDLPSGNVIDTYQPGTKPQGSVRSISWSKKGDWFTVVPHRGFTEIVSVTDQLKRLKTIQDVEEPTCATFQNTTKKFIGMGTKSGLVLIFDVKARLTKKRFPRANSQITHVDFTAKDSHCVTVCKNGEISIYNTTINSPPSLMRIPKSTFVSCLETNKTKQNIILGGSNEGIVCVWDNNTNKSKFVIEAHKAPVSSLTFSPINSDLILTTGLDRQCCFFDIVDNKRITNFAVANNITATDFSPDGTYFAMGSQDGHIYVYDSRNIEECVYSFRAHSHTIKHLSFQNSSSSGSTSSCNLSVETTPVPSEENTNPIRSKRTSDIFRTFIPKNELDDGVPESTKTKKSRVSREGRDSFLAALGLEQNSTVDSIRNDDDVFPTQTFTKLPIITGKDINPVEENKEVVSDKIETLEINAEQYTSTPVFLRKSPDDVNENVVSEKKYLQEVKTEKYTSTPVFFGKSPIYDTTPDTTSKTLAFKDLMTKEKNINEADLQNIKGYIKELTDDLRNEIKLQAMVLRRLIYDTQMAMVRESLKMEDRYNQLREQISGETIRILLEENEELKRKIEFQERWMKHSDKKNDY